MKKITTWTLWLIAAFLMLIQEKLYFKTIFEIKIGSLNIWELNRLFPSLLLFAYSTLFYCLILLLIDYKQFKKRFLNKIAFGVIAILSILPITAFLYINDRYASKQTTEQTYKINDFGMMGGGKSGKDYPAIFINEGTPNKRIPLKHYSKEYVYSKNYAILTTKQGYFGWLIIEDIKLE